MRPGPVYRGASSDSELLASCYRRSLELAAEMNKGKIAPSKKTVKPADKRDADYVFLEQNLIEKLGTKVSLKGNFERGSITIDYFSREDLDRLYNIFFAE